MAIVIAFLISQREHFVEEIYFNRIFLRYRDLWKFVSEASPFPLLYVWLVLLGLLLFLYFMHFKKAKSAIRFLIGFGLIVLSHIAYFYLSWGFNYARQTVASRLNLNAEIPDSMFLTELEKVTAQLSIDRAAILNNEIDSSIQCDQLNRDLNQLLVHFLDSNQLASFTPVRCRILYPKGALLIWTTAGIYWPFAGESQIDGGLDPCEWPFTMAHELAHGMGWTNEGECNFIAYESCIRSEDPRIKYSAQLQYWKYLMNQLMPTDSLIVTNLVSSLSFEVKSDLERIVQVHSKYPEILPEIRDYFYNQYLETNLVQGGKNSYSDVVRLVINYKSKNGVVH